MQPLGNREKQNLSTVTEFILLGLGDLPKLQIPLFLTFFIIYMVTMTGNLLLIMLVVADRHLHTPMYFFLGNLSFLESCYSSNILPRLLSSIIRMEKGISAEACFTQFFLFVLLAGAECYLLSMMSYDRFLAICKPLHYSTLMENRLCLRLAATSWTSGIFLGTSLIISIHSLSFCGPNVIDHYFCDLSAIIKEISCSDTYVYETTVFIFTCVFTLPPFLLTLVSYAFIIATIIRIKSTTGRQKAFSTCSSHLTMVALFYGSLMLVYMMPQISDLRNVKKVFSLFYTVLTPLVNPLIYSLRNKEVKEAMQRTFRKFTIHIRSAFVRRLAIRKESL